MSGDWRTALYDRMPAAIQNRMLSRVGSRLRARRFNDEYTRWMDLCAEAERWSPEQQRGYADEQVQRLVKRCYQHVPYYRRIMEERKLKPENIQGVADLSRLPILTKSDVRRHGHEMVAEDVSRRDLILGHTSGTTGSPLEFWWDQKVEIATNAMVWRHRRFAGVEFGAPYATLLGRLIVPAGRPNPPYWRLNKPWNQLFLSSFHLRPENLDHYIGAMERFKVEALEAYPSNAYLLARHLQSRDRVLPLKAVFTSSETLMDIQRQVIEDRFQCPVYDYYGQAERVMYSGECQEHRGHHHFLEYGAMEVVDDEGRPVPRGTLGRIILTGFANDAMPFLRYEIGDISGFATESCPCGRTLPLIADIATKAEDIVVTPDGRFLSPSVLTHPFKPMKNIEASQIVQEEPAELIIRIVRRAAYSDADTRKLLAGFRERVGPGMQLKVEFVDSLKMSGRGKFRWIISKVPLTFSGQQVANLHEE